MNGGRKTAARLRVDAASLLPEERNLLGELLHAPGEPGSDDLWLRRTPQALELIAPGMRPWRVDFTTASWQARVRSKRTPLARAIGPATRVLDATAGFGRDAFALAAAGFRVAAIERHPAVALMFFDGLTRAAGAPGLGAIVSRVAWQLGDARALLPGLVGVREVDVVYLDPMFAEPGRAEVRKEAQLLRLLVPPDPDATSLFTAARDHGVRRIVVKRQAKQPPLVPDPSGSVRATRVRFDFYLR